MAHPGNVSKLVQEQYINQANWLDRDDIGHLEYILVPEGGFTGPPVNGTDYMSLLSALLHPFSRGSSHSSSNDPLAPSNIDPNFLSNQIDLASMMVAAEFSNRVRFEPSACPDNRHQTLSSPRNHKQG